ncbi:MAG TPA: lipocalin family protein [Flavobacteriaceae bacterium]|nr:lipocalin family protein [Flavobacteriaceae bacterium]
MYPKLLLLFISLIFVGCKKPDPAALKSKLPGYWEIKQVQFPGGDKKEYDMNLVIDHIEIEGDSGKRTKVSPEIDGKFSSNGLSEDFTLEIENDSLYMHYTTPFDSWKEAVIEAQDSILVVKNRENKIYRYKKYVPLNISDLLVE